MRPVSWPEPDPLIAAAITGMYGSRKTERPLAVAIRDRLGQWLAEEDFGASRHECGSRGAKLLDLIFESRCAARCPGQASGLTASLPSGDAEAPGSRAARRAVAQPREALLTLEGRPHRLRGTTGFVAQRPRP